MIVAIVAAIQHFTGTGNSAGKTIRLGDDVVGENSAIGPTAYPKPRRIGITCINRIIHACHDILKVFDAPGRPQLTRKILTIAR